MYDAGVIAAAADDDDDDFVGSGEAGDRLAYRAEVTQVQGSTTSSRKKNVSVWKGDIAEASVGVTAASSYFDRMWSSGNKTKRWYIHVEKEKIK